MSLPSPLEVTHCATFTQLTRRRIRLGILASPFRVVGPHHEGQSVKVDGLPWIAPGQKGKTLLVARPIDQDRPPCLHVLCDNLPQTLADTCGQRPHEYSRRDFHQPASHVPSQTFRHGRQHEDDHQESLSSYATPAATVPFRSSHRRKSSTTRSSSSTSKAPETDSSPLMSATHRSSR